MKPEKPTIMDMSEFKPSARCPNCNLIMYLGNRCPHCDYLLSHTEQKTQREFWLKVRNTGYIKGMVFFTFFFFIAWVLFAES